MRRGDVETWRRGDGGDAENEGLRQDAGDPLGAGLDVDTVGWAKCSRRSTLLDSPSAAIRS